MGCLGIYVKMAWCELLAQIRLHKITLPEAIDIMTMSFGSYGKIWTLHNIEVQVALPGVT